MKGIAKDNREEIDMIICLKKNLKEYQKNYREPKKSAYFFILFLLLYKNEKRIGL